MQSARSLTSTIRTFAPIQRPEYDGPPVAYPVSPADDRRLSSTMIRVEEFLIASTGAAWSWLNWSSTDRILAPREEGGLGLALAKRTLQKALADLEDLGRIIRLNGMRSIREWLRLYGARHGLDLGSLPKVLRGARRLIIVVGQLPVPRPPYTHDSLGALPGLREPVEVLDPTPAPSASVCAREAPRRTPSTPAPSASVCARRAHPPALAIGVNAGNQELPSVPPSPPERVEPAPEGDGRTGLVEDLVEDPKTPEADPTRAEYLKLLDQARRPDDRKRCLAWLAKYDAEVAAKASAPAVEAVEAPERVARIYPLPAAQGAGSKDRVSRGPRPAVVRPLAPEALRIVEAVRGLKGADDGAPGRLAVELVELVRDPNPDLSGAHFRRTFEAAQAGRIAAEDVAGDLVAVLGDPSVTHPPRVLSTRFRNRLGAVGR